MRAALVQCDSACQTAVCTTNGITGEHMADTAESSNPWMDLWRDAQGRYLEAWSQLARQGVAATGEPARVPGSTPWLEGMDLWWKLAAPAMPAAARDTGGKLFDLGKSYLRMAEEVWKVLEHSQTQLRAGADWRKALECGLGKMREGLTRAQARQDDPWSAFATFWGMPLDTWRRVLSSCSLLPGDAEKALRGEGVAADVHAMNAAMHRMLSLPSLGYTREWQEQVQEMGQLWMEHVEATGGYAAILQRIVLGAIDRLQQRLLEAGSQTESIDGLRATYNLWIDCGEAAYAEVVQTGDFIRAQTRLVNSLMALKRQQQCMVDEVLAGLNMPTRTELNTTHRRVQELRRELRELQCLVQDVNRPPAPAGAAEPARQTATARTRAQPTAKKKKSAGTTRNKRR